MTEAEKDICEQLRNADEVTLNHLADRVARRIETERLRDAVREMALMLAVETEIIRRDGMGRALLLAIRRAGLHATLGERGTLHVGPKEKISPDMTALVRTFKREIVRELDMERS